jgi:hypothetical protein
MDDAGRQRVWRLYGWFTALMMCGSCFGAVSWAAKMINRVNIFRTNDLLSTRGNDLKAQAYSFGALAYSWNAAHVVTYATEFLFLSAAQLMVLDRMSDYVTSQGDGARKWWVVGGRAVMAAVVLCNAVGLAASVAAAVYYQKAADAFSAASMLYASNQTNAISYVSSGRLDYQLGSNILSVQTVCETAVLLLIVLVFAVVGVACIRRLSSALAVLDNQGPDMAAQHRMLPRSVIEAMALGRRLRQEVVVTTSFVFVAFLLRSVVSTLIAVANQSQNFAKECPGVSNLCDATCYNVYMHITQWNGYTPEFLPTVVLVSSPLTLLVALWGMTSKLTLQLMRRGMAPTRFSSIGHSRLTLSVTE